MARRLRGEIVRRRVLVAGGAGWASRAVWLVATSLLACGRAADGPPEIVLDRTVCAHCGMLVSEPAFAGGYRLVGGEEKVFDDIACLLSGLEDENAAPGEIWVHDLESGEWIRETAAAFVVDSGFETPMGGGIVAYSDRAFAERVARERGGRLVPSYELLVRKAQAGGPAR
jgi:nitrous oxide reductase accessory protein NosL